MVGGGFIVRRGDYLAPYTKARQPWPQQLLLEPALSRQQGAEFRISAWSFKILPSYSLNSLKIREYYRG